MTLTAPGVGAPTAQQAQGAPALGRDVVLLGSFGGSGYRGGSYLIRRGRQMLQVTPLLYALLECVDGVRTVPLLADALAAQTGRAVTDSDVLTLLDKLAQLGLLAGTEPAEAPAPNPLLALRWKVLVTNPTWTRRITSPFAVLFKPWIMWPVLAAFAGICWYVMVDKGLASATARAFQSPGLLLAVFGLAVASAGFHELGHAAACRYGGVEPGGMGAGLYLVYPAFYTDVSDAYRLDRRGRLRVDLGGLYFNALVAVAVVAVWLAVRNDALLLLVAMQLLQMVRQLSPVIRADGYHILADLTGVPDLFSHIKPTLLSLLPWRRHEPSVLTGRARLLVTCWVLVVVPVLLSLLLGAVLLLPRLLASAWAGGGAQLHLLAHATGRGDVLGVGASLLRLLALGLPVVGCLAIAFRLASTGIRKTWRATEGAPVRRSASLVAAAAAIVGLALAWLPHGQYTPIRASERGTIGSLLRTIAHGSAVPSAFRADATPGVARTFTVSRRLAVAMIPRGGITATRPALFLVPDGSRMQAVFSTQALGGVSAGLASSSLSPEATTGSAVAFPFALPTRPGPQDTQALAIGTKTHGVVYDVAYGLVTVTGGQPVTAHNEAYALASCRACTTVAVSFQLVLVVGSSNVVAPVNAAVAGNANCPSCITTALADQLVVTLSAAPSADLTRQLQAALSKLGDLPKATDPADTQAITAQVAAVQLQVQELLRQSGLLVSASGGVPAPGGSASASAGAATSSLHPDVPVVTASPADVRASNSLTPQPTSEASSAGDTSSGPGSSSESAAPSSAPGSSKSADSAPSPATTPAASTSP